MGNKRFNEFPFWGDENGGARWRWWVHSTVTATAPSVPLKATILMFEETVKQSTYAAGCRWELKLELPCWGYPGPGPEWGPREAVVVERAATQPEGGWPLEVWEDRGSSRPGRHGAQPWPVSPQRALSPAQEEWTAGSRNPCCHVRCVHSQPVRTALGHQQAGPQDSGSHRPTGEG